MQETVCGSVEFHAGYILGTAKVHKRALSISTVDSGLTTPL